MTRMRSLLVLWLMALPVWWLAAPGLLAMVAGVSEAIAEADPVDGLRGAIDLYATLIMPDTWEGLVVLGSIALLASGLQVALAAPIVPPYRAATEGRSMLGAVIAAAVVAGALTTVLGLALVEVAGLLAADDLLLYEWGDGPALLICFGGWLLASSVWTGILWHAGRSSNPDRMAALVRRAFQGSALQVVLGLPLYVIARRRESCFCALSTFWSLCVGLSALLLLCGPGAVVLLTRGHRRLWRAGACAQCGHMQFPGATHCPECGGVVQRE